MRNSRLWILALSGIALLIVTGVLLAWPVNYSLWGPGPPPPAGGSLSGTNFMSLAFNPTPPLLDADDLINDINSQGGSAISVSQCDPLTGGLITYTGFSGTNFPIVPDEGYFVTVAADSNYVITPAHDPTHTVVFDQPGPTSLTGTHCFALPDHRVPLDIDALGLISLVDQPCCGGVNAVCRFLRPIDGLECYTGFSGTNFPLVPGDAYVVNVNATRIFNVP